MATVIAPLASGAAPSLSPQQVVQRAWQRAQEVGVYHFATDIAQTTYPAPRLTNVGRSSRQETLHIEGETDLPARTMQMALWQGGGSVLNPRDGVEVRIEGDQAYGREIGGLWQEVDDFSGAFAPGNDLLAYLAGAKNVRLVGTETVTIPDQGDTQYAIRNTKYAFDVDGPAFEDYIHDQLERHLIEKGELPAGLTLDVSREYRGVIGEGEVWIDSDGLPARLRVNLEYPQQRNGERIKADITTDFSNFDREMLAVASNWAENPAAWLASTLGLPRTPRDWQQAGRQASVAMSLLGLVLLAIIYRQSKKVYAAVVATVILSMVVTPLLQSQQAVAFFDRQQARQAEQEESRQEYETARDWQEQLLSSDWDPHADPLASASSDQSPISNNQSPTSNLHFPTSNLQLPIPNLQLPTPTRAPSPAATTPAPTPTRTA